MQYGVGCARRKTGRLVLGYALFVGLAAIAGIVSLASAAFAQELFVTNFDGDSITVYNRTDNGNVAPLRTIVGAATGLNGPKDIALSSPAAIPTLSEWAQIGMAALLVGGGLLAISRKRQVPTLLHE